MSDDPWAETWWGTFLNLKGTRDQKVRTQRELAEVAGVSQTTIVQLENKNSSARFSTVRKLAEALGVASEDLL